MGYNNIKVEETLFQIPQSPMFVDFTFSCGYVTFGHIAITFLWGKTLSGTVLSDARFLTKKSSFS
ncbi:MAG: hypothetical protein IKI58_10100 [Oscillospiraceae bacterium]|nr:hypothetical protein [Oscillospiraceae bacterium]